MGVVRYSAWSRATHARGVSQEAIPAAEVLRTTPTGPSPAKREQATRAGTPVAGPCSPAVSLYLMCSPEIAREMTRRWISEVPSKIV